jgi:AI-2 transport protein TqsA
VINLNLSDATRVGLNLLALLGIVIALRLGESIFIPLVIAVLLAALVWPSADWLNRRMRLPWSLACMLVVGGLVVLNLLVTTGFVLAVPKMLQGMPDLRTDSGQQRGYEIIRERVGMVIPLDDDYFPPIDKDPKVFRYIQQALQEGKYVTNFLWTAGYYGNSWLWEWVLIMFILLFLTLEGRMLSRRVVEIFGPSKEAQAKAVATLSEMARAVRTYLVWRTIVNFSLALVVGLVYQWVFQLSQPWTWALLTAVACYVPYLGPIFAGIPPVLDAFITHDPLYALAVIAFYVAVITVEGYVLVPVVMGRSMELNATTVMLACLFWELVWGLPGLFLAMPLMAALKAVCAHVPGWQAWANLMGTSEVPVDLDKTELMRAEKLLDDTQVLATPLETGASGAARSAVIDGE